jgi:23S rRNA (uracil1939-C5)-methyltransferase
VEGVLGGPRRLPAGADAAVLDPPRRGLPPGCTEALAELAPRRIAMLSCDPATLARDLAKLCTRGFALRSVRGFDLFPQTAHVEALAVLER